MKTAPYVLVALLAGCNCLVPVTELEDGGAGGGAAGGTAGAGGGSTAGGTGGGTGGGSAGGSAGSNGGTDGGVCYTQPVTSPFPGPNAPAWETGSCPDAGCPANTICLKGHGEGSNVYGCAPVPASCNGSPSCACMGCVCGWGCSDLDQDGLPDCFNGTISRREFKDDIRYVSGGERAELAKQALSMRLAHYRYKGTPRVRL